MLLRTLFLLFLTSSLCAKPMLITGSSTVAPLIEEIARKYEKENSGIRINVQTGGSTRGIIEARNQTNDIGMISRALTKSENDLLGHKIALDGIGIIVHKSNPITDISKKNLVKIYKGEIKNWNELGGADQKIVVINKAEGRSTLELFQKYTNINSSEIKAHIIIGDNEQGVKTVSVQKSSIGYVSIGTAQVNLENNLPIKLLSIEGIEASQKNVKKFKYPITRELNLVTKKNLSKEKQDFINYVQKSKKIIEELYFVSIE